MLLLVLPSMGAAQAGYANSGQPPIGQPLIREGDFAVQLAPALSLGTPRDEVEAENLLSGAGISPMNGWISDYPVTPDIVGELYKGVRDAASSGKIRLSVDVALQKLKDVMSQGGLTVDTQAGAKTESAEPPGPQSYPGSAVINNYYQIEGPPAVTYYAPPPDYSYLYGWVPFPFWCANVWFPGFFILHDFHRTVFIDNRVVFVSNHFNDIRRQRIIRLDPIARIRGINIAGTRVIHTRGDIAAGTLPRNLAITRELRMHPVSGNNVSRGAGSSARFFSEPRSERTVTPPENRSRISNMPSRGGRMISLTPLDDRSERMPLRGNSTRGARWRR